MLYFTVLRHSRQLIVGPLDDKDRPPYYCQFYSAECIIGQRDGNTYMFHVTEIRSESNAAISGYCVEGECQL